MMMHSRTIRKTWAVLFVMSGLSVTARGQIEVDTRLSHRVYLQHEPVDAVTRVKSQIGQAVVFNATGNGPRFYYEVRDDDGIALPLRAEAASPETIMAAAQDVVLFTNDMIRLYAMGDPGQYTVQPCVDWMGKAYRGEKRHFEVVSGREVTRISAVVPADQSLRTYKIFHINRGHQDHILLRIDDENAGVCFGVYPLGRSVSNEKPQLAVDSRAHAHLLFQSAPRLFTHAVYAPNGAAESVETFGADYSTVKLQSQPNGSIQAVGRRDTSSQPRMLNSVIENR